MSTVANNRMAHTAGGFVGGIVLAKLTGVAIDKMLPYEPDPSGKFNMKSLVKPASLLILGGLGIYFGRPKANWGKKDVNGAYDKHKAWVQGLGFGFTFSGFVVVSQRVLKVNPFESMNGLGAPTVDYSATTEEINRMLEENKFQPDLPMLNEGGPAQNDAVNGASWGSDLNTSNSAEPL